MDGVEYRQPVLIELSEYRRAQVVEYDLGNRYTTFSATAGFADNFSDTVRPWRVTVGAVRNGEESLLFDQTMAFGATAPISVPVTDVLRLRITIEMAADSYGALGSNRSFVIADAMLR